LNIDGGEGVREKYKEMLYKWRMVDSANHDCMTVVIEYSQFHTSSMYVPRRSLMESGMTS